MLHIRWFDSDNDLEFMQIPYQADNDYFNADTINATDYAFSTEDMLHNLYAQAENSNENNQNPPDPNEEQNEDDEVTVEDIEGLEATAAGSGSGTGGIDEVLDILFGGNSAEVNALGRELDLGAVVRTLIEELEPAEFETLNIDEICSFEIEIHYYGCECMYSVVQLEEPSFETCSNLAMSFNIVNGFAFVSITLDNGEYVQQLSLPVEGEVSCDCPIVSFETYECCLTDIEDILYGENIFYDCEENCYTILGKETTNGITYTLSACEEAQPIVIDLDGDGVELLTPASGVLFDMDGDGDLEKTGWVNPDDALLAYDANNDGLITDIQEISFSLYHEDAQTDLQGLQLAFDSNNDNLLDQQDEAWAQMGLWQDSNSNGQTDEGEFVLLSDSNILSINLISDGLEANNNGNKIYGTTEYTLDDGTTQIAQDVGLSYNDMLNDETLESLFEDNDLLNNEIILAVNMDLHSQTSENAAMLPVIDLVTDSAPQSDDALL